MKKILLLIYLLAGLCPLATFSQELPAFEWKSHAKKINATTFEISVETTLPDPWYVYAEGGFAEGLDTASLIFGNPGIQKSGALQPVYMPLHLQDPVFNQLVKVYRPRVRYLQRIVIQEPVPAFLKITLHAFASNGTEFLPIDQEMEVPLEGGVENKAGNLKISSVMLDRPVNGCGDEFSTVKTGLWAIFLKGLAGGLLALLMPCIFPMLPVTVSFFMYQSTSKSQGVKNGLLYAAFIFLIYLLASLPFHLAGSVNPQIFNIISTDYRINLAFFVIFTVFALSLFGLFHLRLPGAIANRAEKKSSTATMGGIFFMALTLAIVSFSCTGPILGFLLVNSITDNGGAYALSAGMAGFGLALAVPFGLFAMFPGWMKKLPKSGGWMNTLKISLAFVELALAIKFLSNADLVEHWGILKREVFIGIWILITLGLGLYLLGAFTKKPKIPKGLYNADLTIRRNKELSMPRLICGMLVIMFALYLVPGLTRSRLAALNMVSGFPPPLSYSIYKKSYTNSHSPEPHAINDYEKALALSKKHGKPLLIDFTGWACVNCRKMEENVWTSKKVSALIKDEFILVSLYVDDRQMLSPNEQFTYKDQSGKSKVVRTVGEKWAIFQASNFGSASQPQYVILSPDQTLLNRPVGFSPAADYQQWLECGINAFKKSL